MKKQLKKLALVAIFLASGLSGLAHADAYTGSEINNWRDASTGLTWMNGTNEHCWRDAFWTADTASKEFCGKPAPAPAYVAPVIVAPAYVPPTPLAPAPVVPVPQITTEKFTFAADALFDFDKATLKDEGRAKLDELIANLKDPSMKLEVVVAVGHTDSFGKDAYNDKLSAARAQAVRSYIVNGGIDASKVYAEGKGKRMLKVDPKSCSKKRAERIVCEAPSRRVEIEVSGAKTITKMVMPTQVVAPAK
jgi:OmpA-OmpF porin, OOP family